jgi:hypothetical protein
VQRSHRLIACLVRSMGRAVRLLLAVVCLSWLSGCVIAHDWTGRAASGTVVDARSGKPLGGVSVYRVIGQEPKLVATTDSAGRFSVAASDRLYVTLPMGDAFYSCSLVFRLPSYQEQKIDCSTGMPAPKTPPIPPTIVKLRKKT